MLAKEAVDRGEDIFFFEVQKAVNPLQLPWDLTATKRDESATGTVLLSVTNKPKEQFSPEPKIFVEECGLWPPGVKEPRRGLGVHVYPKSCLLGKETQMCEPRT